MFKRLLLLLLILGNLFAVELPDEVVAYWKLDEGTGNAIDALEAYDLAEQGTVPNTTGIIGAARGPYNTFNYFANSSSVFNATYFAVEGWFKTSGTGEGIIGKSGTTSGWWVEVTTYGYVQFALWGLSGFLVSPAAYNDGEWHYFYAANGPSSSRRLYVDNVLVASGTGGSFTTDSGNMTVGRRSTVTGGEVSGAIDECVYWNLTATSKSWTDIEAFIDARWNDGKGAPYGGVNFTDKNFLDKNFLQKGQ